MKIIRKNDESQNFNVVISRLIAKFRGVTSNIWYSIGWLFRPRSWLPFVNGPGHTKNQTNQAPHLLRMVVVIALWQGAALLPLKNANFVNIKKR